MLAGPLADRAETATGNARASEFPGNGDTSPTHPTRLGRFRGHQTSHAAPAKRSMANGHPERRRGIFTREGRAVGGRGLKGRQRGSIPRLLRK